MMGAATPRASPKAPVVRAIREGRQTELFRTKRLLKNKNAARDKLKSLLSEKWLWLIIPNNCTDSGLVKTILD